MQGQNHIKFICDKFQMIMYS